MTETLPGMPKPPPPVEPIPGGEPCSNCYEGTHRHYTSMPCTCTCHVDQVWVRVTWEVELQGAVDVLALARKYPKEYADALSAPVDPSGGVHKFLDDLISDMVESDLTDIDHRPQVVWAGGPTFPEWDFRLSSDQEAQIRAAMEKP